MDVTGVQTARRLALELNRLSQLAAAIADEAVYGLTRHATAKDVADELGVTEPTVRKAVRQHNERRGTKT